MDNTRRSLAFAAKECPPHASELADVNLDFRILVHIAAYHSQRLLAATHFAFFHKGTGPGRKITSLSHMRNVRW